MTEFLWLLIIYPVAVWRLTHMVYLPEKIADVIHVRAGRKMDAAGDPTYPDTWTAYLVQCYYCLSMWMGVLMLVLYLISPYLILPFFASAVTIFIEERKRG